MNRFASSLIAAWRLLTGGRLATKGDKKQTRQSPQGQAQGKVRPISVLDGGEVALEVLQAIGYRNVLKTATIVSFNMQDYDFWGQGRLSHLLRRQLSYGAAIRLMTTPPPGNPNNQAFKTKYKLLSELVRNGVSVFLNEQLHVKAYLFLDTTNEVTTIIGSPNLTAAGFGMHLMPTNSLIEMAVATDDSVLYADANAFVDTKILGDKRTEDFSTWFTKNSTEIGKAGI